MFRFEEHLLTIYLELSVLINLICKTAKQPDMVCVPVTPTSREVEEFKSRLS